MSRLVKIYTYSIDGHILENVNVMRDLSLIFYSKMTLNKKHNHSNSWFCYEGM